MSALAGGLTAAGVNASFSVVGTTLTKAFSPTIIGKNAASTLTFTIANGAGNPAQAGLAFTDTLLANLLVATPNGLVNNCGGAVTATAGSGSIALAGGSLAAAQASCTIAVNVTSALGGSYANGAGNISGATATMNTGGVNATLTVLEVPTIAKAFAPNPIGAGGVSTLTFTLTNINPSNALTGVAFNDTFPIAPGNMVVAAVPNATTSGCGAPTFTPVAGAASIAFSAGTIAASGTCTVTVDVRAPIGGGIYNNTSGTVSATGPSALTGGTASASLTVNQPSLNKAFAPTTIDQGGTSTLTFTLTNSAGNPAQSGINFTDTLPANVVVAATPNITTTCPSGTGVVTAVAAAGTITVTGATMNSAQASCVVTVDVTSNVPGGPYNNTAASIGATQNVTNSVTASGLTVRALPTLTKAFAPATVGVGQVEHAHLHDHQPGRRAGAHRPHLHRHAARGRRDRGHAERGEQLRRRAHHHGGRGHGHLHRRRHGRERRGGRRARAR